MSTLNYASLYSSLIQIRIFEETVLENFAGGVFSGTTHTCIGQEADAVGVLHCIDHEKDIVVSNHRSHGHFLAYGGDAYALFAELMGKVSGVCGGWGGSQHLHWRNFYANGIQGGMIPTATGMALAEKKKGSNAVTVAFMGDGTLGEGVIYEAFNMAALWKAPILFVLEDNRIAQTTPTRLALAGEMAARFSAFGIPVMTLDSSDVLEILSATEHLLQMVRSGAQPAALVLHTYRFASHSKGDDTRPAEEVAKIRAEHDPIVIHAARLSETKRNEIEKGIRVEIEAAYQKALQDEFAHI